jgi:hypothetical protein
MNQSESARAALRAQLEDAAGTVVTHIEQLVDRRLSERARVADGKVFIEPNLKGTIGYKALRRHVRDALVEQCVASTRSLNRAPSSMRRDMTTRPKTSSNDVAVRVTARLRLERMATMGVIDPSTPKT